MAEKDKSEENAENTIRPLSEQETAQHIDFYKDFLINQWKNDPKTAHLCDKIDQLSYVHNQIDPKCILEVKNKMVRIEFPGVVENVDKVLRMLGKLEAIEASVADHKKKLFLNFSPENKYNKPCMADRDFKPGLLIKVKLDRDEKDATLQPKLSYEVHGVSVINFLFNRLCDFQYQPLTTKEPEKKDSMAECIYDQILPKKLPELAWFESEQSKNMNLFLVPVRFSCYDNAQVKFVDDKVVEKDLGDNQGNQSSPKRTMKIHRRMFTTSHSSRFSIFVNFKDKEIPTKPLEATLKLLKTRALDDKLKRVKELFDERPIWTKSGIMYHAGLTADHAKILMAVVAYYFINGPFRILWVKFGYDPRLDSKSRIFQTLDYRIRTAESSALKVSAKRNYTCRTSLTLGPANIKKFSLKDNVAARPKFKLEEKNFILRPNTIPPARQMFYQFCDLQLPEIQEMINRLPRYPEQICDAKNGWLPRNFQDQCREIVNKYVLQAVQKELLEDDKANQEKASKQEVKKKAPTSSLDYCSQMLSNIKKGIYKNVDIKLAGPSGENVKEAVEFIDISSDEDEDVVGDIIKQTIPERLEDEEEEQDLHYEDESESSDGEIDYEAVKEISQMLAETKKES